MDNFKKAGFGKKVQRSGPILELLDASYMAVGCMGGYNTLQIIQLIFIDQAANVRGRFNEHIVAGQLEKDGTPFPEKFTTLLAGSLAVVAITVNSRDPFRGSGA
jgi:hypothetical protein